MATRRARRILLHIQISSNRHPDPKDTSPADYSRIRHGRTQHQLLGQEAEQCLIDFSDSISMTLLSLTVPRNSLGKTRPDLSRSLPLWSEVSDLSPHFALEPHSPSLENRATMTSRRWRPLWAMVCLGALGTNPVIVPPRVPGEELSTNDTHESQAQKTPAPLSIARTTDRCGLAHHIPPDDRLLIFPLPH